MNIIVHVTCDRVAPAADMLSDILPFGNCQLAQMERLFSMSNCAVMHPRATCKQFMGGLD